MALQLEERRTPREPGPLPTFGQSGRSVGALGAPDAAGLEAILGRLEVWFAVVIAVSLPFIGYVLCFKAGFDLTYLTYPLLLVAMVVVTAMSWSGSGIAGRFGGLTTLRWLPVQSLPIAGFVMWRFGIGGLYRLIPLAAAAWVFVAIVSPLRRSAPR